MVKYGGTLGGEAVPQEPTIKTFKTEAGDKIVIVKTVESECCIEGDMDLPPLTIYGVEITNQLSNKEEGGSWSESWGSNAELQAYLRGLSAGFGMSGVHLNLIIDEEGRPT